MVTLPGFTSRKHGLRNILELVAGLTAIVMISLGFLVWRLSQEPDFGPTRASDIDWEELPLFFEIGLGGNN